MMNLSRRVRGFLVVGLLLGCTVSVALAQEVTIFGVKQYTKPKGQPFTSSDFFFAPAGVGNTTITLKNGTGNKDAVKNFSITLNDVEVLSSNELGGADTLTKPVSLLPENTLKVTSKGAEGNTLFVSIQGSIVEPRR